MAAARITGSESSVNFCSILGAPRWSAARPFEPTKYFIRPSAKIAQGFGSTLIRVKDETGKGTTDYSGFIVREAADEVQLRDLTGHVTMVPKNRIVQRLAMSGSMMPEGSALQYG